MSSSSSSKKLHHFEMHDGLNWPNKVSNQLLMQCAPGGPSGSNQPQPMLQNDSTSTHEEKPKPAAMGLKEPVSKNRMLEPLEIYEDKQWMPKLKIVLTREEIEEDYFGMTGRKLPRNMMKRDKSVQKDLDALFPAISLEDRKTDNLPKRY